MSIEWKRLLNQAQLLAATAQTEELAGQFDLAFTSYIKAAQSYLSLLRNNATDPNLKDQLRSVSKALVERAERIKLKKGNPVPKNKLSKG